MLLGTSLLPGFFCVNRIFGFVLGRFRNFSLSLQHSFSFPSLFFSSIGLVIVLFTLFLVRTKVSFFSQLFSVPDETPHSSTHPSCTTPTPSTFMFESYFNEFETWHVLGSGRGLRCGESPGEYEWQSWKINRYVGYEWLLVDTRTVRRSVTFLSFIVSKSSFLSLYCNNELKKSRKSEVSLAFGKLPSWRVDLMFVEFSSHF